MAYIDARGTIWIEAHDAEIIEAITASADAHPELFGEQPALKSVPSLVSTESASVAGLHSLKAAGSAR